MLNSIEKLRNALTEVRAQRSQFSPLVFDTLVSTLLEKIQHDRAKTESKNDTVKADEIRLVTVMFVDVVESTSLSQRMEGGDWKDLISHAHGLMVTAILESEGNVGQFLGDGMLCYFGAQHSRRDDALRAVNCALMIQERMETYSEEAMRHYKMETGFAIRISLSTGRVVVGMIGSEDKQELLALGPATNLASRLQSFAKPQTIVIDAQTQQRIRTYFKLQSHDPVQVKGFEDEVSYYTVLDKIENPSVEFTNNQVSGRTIPFVGRNPETKQILDIWQQSQVNQQFQVVSILGEIGIGKSRLLQHVIETISEQPVTQIHMFADYERRDMSHNLLQNLLIKQCNLTDDTLPDVAKERISDYVASTWNDPDANTVGNVLGILYTNDLTTDNQSETVQRSGHLHQRMIFLWVSRWFSGMGRSSPVLIIVDNLQWIDSLSLELLEYLAFALQDEIGMIIAAGRNDVRVNNSEYMKHVLNHSALVLPPLENSSTIDLMQQVLEDVTRLNKSIIQSIAERSNGNPLFLREFLSILFDNGVISLKNDKYTFNLIKYHATLSELPGGLTGVLQARLDELPAQARTIVQAAAAVGQRFWSGVISEMVGFNTDPYLNELAQRGIIYQNAESSFDNEHEFQFRHNLYQEVAYKMLPRAQRESYHSNVTRWMVTRMAGKPEYFPMLADQFAKSDQHEAALFTYLEAVQNRLGRGLLDETLALVESGLAQAFFVPRDAALPVTSQLWAIRAQAYNALNRFGEASAAADSALRLLEELPDDQLLNVRVTAARFLGMAQRSMGRYSEAFEALTQAHNLMPEDDKILLSQVLGAFGSLSLYCGKLGESLAYQQRAYTHAETADRRSELNGILTQLGLIAFEQGNLAQALDYFESVLNENLDRENIHYQILDLRNIGATYLSVFAYEKAIITFERAQELEKYIHQKDALLQAYRALALIEVGQIDEGIDQMQDAVSRGHKDTYHNLQIQLVQIEGWVKVKRYEDALEAVGEFLEITRDLNPILYGRGLLWKGQIYHKTDPSLATTLLEQALQYESDHAGWYMWLCHYALAQATTDDSLRHQRLTDAFNILSAIGLSLSSRPDIQALFRQSDAFHQIEKMIETV
jgi:class 3 adenylate cyclase/tetratricopeptide (TPR) repeat protein